MSVEVTIPVNSLPIARDCVPHSWSVGDFFKRFWEEGKLGSFTLGGVNIKQYKTTGESQWRTFQSSDVVSDGIYRGNYRNCCNVYLNTNDMVLSTDIANLESVTVDIELKTISPLITADRSYVPYEAQDASDQFRIMFQKDKIYMFRDYQVFEMGQPFFFGRALSDVTVAQLKTIENPLEKKPLDTTAMIRELVTQGLMEPVKFYTIESGQIGADRRTPWRAYATSQVVQGEPKAPDLSDPDLSQEFGTTLEFDNCHSRKRDYSPTYAESLTRNVNDKKEDDA